MKRTVLSWAVGSLACLAGWCLAMSAQADEVADFYNGKTITLLISTGVGGSNDLNARTLMHHMVKHIPGQPDYVAVNMPGAGHVRATNYLYNVAPHDGTYIGAFVRFFILHQALGGKGVRYDARKFNYLGSTSVSNVTLNAIDTAKISRFEELKTKQLIVGGTGVGSGTVIFPTIFNALLGTKIKIVQGYKSGHNIDLAMERGEIMGRAGNTFESIEAVHPSWIRDGKLKILLQIGLRKEPGYEHIPLATDLAANDDDRQVLKLYSGVIAAGSPFFTNQDVPKARVAALRKAFAATMKDPDYLADAKKKKLKVHPTSAGELTEIVAGVIDAPDKIIEKARVAVARKGLVKCTAFTQAKYCRTAKKKKAAK